MARDLPEEDRERFDFVAGDNEPNEEYLDSTRPEGYAPARARSLPYRYEEWGRLSSLLAVSQEIVARIEQLRAARPDTQIALDDIALNKDKPDGVAYMTAHVERCLMDISTHCSAIGLLASHTFSRATRTTDPTVRVYGTSSAIAVHQRAIIESASALLWVVNPPKAADRYLRLVQAIRDEMGEWDRHLMAEQYDTVLPMEDLIGRVVSRYALEFKSKGARNQAANDTKTKKSRTQMIQKTLGEDIFWVWKRTTMDSHGSALLNEVLLAEDSPFLPHADARFRANGTFAAVRAVLDRLKVILETSAPTHP